eukprot:CAMPEP_0183750492 /NCGR_PEP_ID=MMETSP0739-20130205/1137_1 /TAXON_ID=385413 /ORGANISM="Thalassiosira miniscula, Strain CCMP1093" /LENGTH=323 /DNA_ID=CAMNT_0025986547 /DNA_START=46 /DNA_END=1017 /DNA_ORIENTATION=-
MGPRKAIYDCFEGSKQEDDKVEERCDAELKQGLLFAGNADENAPKVANHTMLWNRHIALSILSLIIAFAIFRGTTVVSNKPTSQSKQRTPWTVDENEQLLTPRQMILIDSSLLWCPTAKSGTTTIYTVLWKNKLLPEGRCYGFQGCEHAAKWALKNWTGPKPLSFVVVRNPWDRIRSAYVSGKEQNKYGKTNVDISSNTFSDFVKYVERHPHENIHWKPVSKHCKTGGGQNNTDVFLYDHIIKLEDGDLTTRLEEIFEEAGIDLPNGIEKGHKNQNKTSGASSLADFYRQEAKLGNTTMKELIESVARTYADDIRTFGYSFPQ